MRAYNDTEYNILKEMLNVHNEFDIIQKALSRNEIIIGIDENMAYVCDRLISELLDKYLKDDTAIGTAFILGIMQGKRHERMKNSDKRTTASRSI